MSRTADITLSGWVVDTKIEDKAEFLQLYYDKGPLGFYIYILMRNIICGQYGYYAVLNNSLINSIHCKLGRWTRPVKFIKELIEYFGEVGILDKSLLKDNILTSVDIQKSWLIAKKAQRTVLKNVNLEHWLLVDTLPTDTSNNTYSNNDNSCTRYSDTCYKKEDTCTQDTTRQLVQINNKINNISENSENAQSEFTLDSVLEIIYSKHERLKNIINAQEYSENAILYAGYWANACNDERYMSYSVDADKATLNNDFFINCLFLAEANEILRIFKTCYERQPNIRESVEWYFRGIIVQKYRRLAKKYQERFQRGRA